MDGLKWNKFELPSPKNKNRSIIFNLLFTKYQWVMAWLVGFKKWMDNPVTTGTISSFFKFKNSKAESQEAPQ